MSTEYVQYTQVSVKKFGLKKLKGTDNNILNILSLFIFLTTIKIDYELSLNFQEKTFVACTWIGVGHADNNVVFFCNFWHLASILSSPGGVQLIESLYRSVPRCLTHICRFTVHVENFIIKYINSCLRLVHHLSHYLWYP